MAQWTFASVNIEQAQGLHTVNYINELFQKERSIQIARIPLNDTVLIVSDKFTLADKRKVALRCISKGYNRFPLCVALMIPKQGTTLNYGVSSLKADPTKIIMEYLRWMVASPFSTGSLSLNDNEWRRLLIMSIGSGLLSEFFHEKFEKTRVTAIELDEDIADASRKYFGLRKDAFNSTFTMNEVNRNKSRLLKGNYFDALLLDVCSSRPQLIWCPIEKLQTVRNIALLKSLLKENGTLVVHITSAFHPRDETIYPLVMEKVEKIIKIYEKNFNFCARKDIATTDIILTCTDKIQGNFSRKIEDAFEKLGFARGEICLNRQFSPLTRNIR
ncbi:hypothetical protein AB6A40_002176 [Gnathostoma spinigerum]|uniref:Uncharacterized protein n=1 Tax=Gnathostoma spinigerum TaxID=75299 RepID=A0ABD6EFL7_9BILA